ncbi:putative transcriptional regulator domain protein [Wolbachia endosymbiont of Trichogramma pretiosum]|nr:putative transcriptional regulator domain protein [Wolbachia endosymbiont of Trichogramma pretiosum]
MAKGLVKEGVSAHIISQTTSLSIDEYDNDEKKFLFRIK